LEAEQAEARKVQAQRIELLWQLKSSVGNIQMPIFDEDSEVEEAEPYFKFKKVEPIEIKPCEEEINMQLDKSRV
jgi:hypothetical protein